MINDFTQKSSVFYQNYTNNKFCLGAAVIIRPPENQTVLENAELRVPCEGQAEPSNFTTKWYVKLKAI